MKTSTVSTIAFAPSGARPRGPLGPRLVGPLVALWSDGRERWRRWQLQRETRDALERLSPHELRDIGLVRLTDAPVSYMRLSDWQ